MPKNLVSIPDELQLKVLSVLDSSSLASICRVEKNLSLKATLFLWRDIELKADMRLAQRFFVACDTLISKTPDRWKELAGQVRRLNIGHLPGVGIPIGEEPYQENNQEELAWVTMFCKDHCVGGSCEKHCERDVYDIIFAFSNLEELDFFIVEPWDMDESWRRREEMTFPRLKRLNIGGCFHKEFLDALFASPAELKHLSCSALQDLMADQTCGPSQARLLSNLPPKITNLTTLHLCKLAQLQNHNEDTGVEFVDQENDRAVLEDWSRFLERVSETLVDVTLEHRYYSLGRFAPEEKYKSSLFTGDDRDKGEGDRALDSRTRFNEILLPVIAAQAWPNLQSLTIVGLDTAMKNQKILHELANFQPRVQIQFGRAGTVDWNYDATPLVVDPPGGYFDGY